MAGPAAEASGERPAEQLGALSHAGQPVAAAVTYGRRRVAGGEVLDGKAGPGGVIGQADLDPRGVGMPDHVGECFLSYPVQGEAGFRAETSSMPRHGKRARDAVVTLERAGQRAQGLGTGKLLAA